VAQLKSASSPPWETFCRSCPPPSTPVSIPFHLFCPASPVLKQNSFRIFVLGSGVLANEQEDAVEGAVEVAHYDREHVSNLCSAAPGLRADL